MFLAKSNTPTFASNPPPPSDNNENPIHSVTVKPSKLRLDAHQHHRLGENTSVQNSIPTTGNQSNTTNNIAILQTPVYPDDLGQSPTDSTDPTNMSSQPLQSVVGDDFDNGSWEDVRIGNDKNAVIHNTLVATGFTAGRTISPESDSNPERASELCHGVSPRQSPNTYPNERRQSTSTSDPISAESAPENDIDPSSKREQLTADSNPKHSDSASVDNSTFSSEPMQSLPAIPLVPVIIITSCASRSPSPPIHTSPAPSSTQSLSAPDAEIPIAITVSQPSTTHVPSALDQAIPISMPNDHVHFDTQSMRFVHLTPATEAYAQFVYKEFDMDVSLDTFSGPSYPPYHHPTAINISFDAPEMWLWSDMQQGPNKDDDFMDLDLDDPMVSWSDLYDQSCQVDFEMAYAGDWPYAEVITTDVEMENAILAEPEVVHEVYYEQCPPTPMILDDLVSFLSDVVTMSDPVDAPVSTQTLSVAATTSYQTCPKAQEEEVVEPVSVQNRTPETQHAPTLMTIPPLHPQLLMGDMTTFIQQIVDTLNSLTSLEQTVAAVQRTATGPVSAANRQPMAHEVIQKPDSKVPELSPNTSDGDELKETAQSEDIDTNIYPVPLPDYGAELNNPNWSIPRRSPTRHGWRSMNAPLTILPPNGGEMQITDKSANCRGLLLTHHQSATSRAQGEFPLKQTKDISRSSCNINSSRARRSIKFAVDIANTRLSFGTETLSEQSSAPSTALRVEVSSCMGSNFGLSTPAAPQLDKAVETQSFWGSLWATKRYARMRLNRKPNT